MSLVFLSSPPGVRFPGIVPEEEKEEDQEEEEEQQQQEEEGLFEANAVN